MAKATEFPFHYTATQSIDNGPRMLSSSPAIPNALIHDQLMEWREMTDREVALRFAVWFKA